MSAINPSGFESGFSDLKSTLDKCTSLSLTWDPCFGDEPTQWIYAFTLTLGPESSAFARTSGHDPLNPWSKRLLECESQCWIVLQFQLE